ncbi:MAG: hypothetical protein IPK02_14765 [Candidatus Accumulibacter sp.]|uniref:Uncharacterized protein n=1 Tax=Candidatus Accumulibacter affinis TaxID=2954384 RepID=A0A935TBR5_9PROT|nr:hypothetical protein [Candidatus Accumulibacter affinis]
MAQTAAFVAQSGASPHWIDDHQPENVVCLAIRPKRGGISVAGASLRARLRRAALAAEACRHRFLERIEASPDA